jgi:NADH:quinone reductase (non-electrogenic)
MRNHHRTLILGGGFAGGHVARMLGPEGATIVSPESSMLYTPLLPEVAAGAIEPRHVVVPLRMMCPDAAVVVGRATGLDEGSRTVTVETDLGCAELGYERLVVALGSTARMLPVPGLAAHAMPFKDLADAIRLRNHVLRQLDVADADPDGAARPLTFVFAGSGYAGVEALAELKQLVDDAMRYYPRLAGVEQRWVLLSRGPAILREAPQGLGDYAADLLHRRGVDIRLRTKIESVDAGTVALSDGTKIPAGTLVWTAGVTPNRLVAELGLPLDGRGRIIVDSTLRVEGRSDVWAIGDCARVPNAATADEPDPPTCQHALQQARALVRSLGGSRAPYRYRTRGAGATLGRDRGIAAISGLRLKGRMAGLVTRAYHLSHVPLRSRRLRILADGTLSIAFRRDIASLGAIEVRRQAG